MTGTYKNLDAWKKSVKLMKEIYQISKKFPEEEKYDLTSQIRRAVKSISTNIAEGSGSSSYKRKLYHFEIAFGSSNEVDNLLTLSQELGYVEENKFKDVEDLIVSTRKPLSGLIKYTKAKINESDS